MYSIGPDVARAVAVAAAMAPTAAMADPTFASTTAAVGGVDPVWKVATSIGQFDDGKATFRRHAHNVSWAIPTDGEPSGW